MLIFWLTLHILAATLWVGGMMFAHLALRPTLAEALEPPQRLQVWHGVLMRFFRNVWLAIIVLHASGYVMLFGHMGGMKGAGMHVHAMLGIAWVMTIIFVHIYMAPFGRLKDAVASEDWPKGGAAMGSIRPLVTVNLVLGLFILGVGATGRYWGQ